MSRCSADPASPSHRLPQRNDGISLLPQEAAWGDVGPDVDLGHLASYIWLCRLKPFVRDAAVDRAREWADALGGQAGGTTEEGGGERTEDDG